MLFTKIRELGRQLDEKQYRTRLKFLSVVVVRAVSCGNTYACLPGYDAYSKAEAQFHNIGQINIS